MKTIFIARQENLFEQFAFPHFEISEDYRIIDQILEDESIVLELAKDIPDASMGRSRTPVERTLRFLVLKHQKGLDYRGLEQSLKENLSDRWFCKYSASEKTPCFKTIQNQLTLINEETIKKINDIIMLEARKRKLTKGKRLRVDSTVTEANIHYPTDASLIADGIRVINRTVKKLKTIPKGYRSFSRKIKQQMNIIRSIGRRNKEVRQKAIRELVRIGKAVSKKIKTAQHKTIKKYKKILDKIITQTEQSLIGEKPKNRIVSIFEPDARPLPKGKANRPCEFGSAVQVQEDEKFITNWEIDKKLDDAGFLHKAIDKHKELYHKPPTELATDRGYWSPDNHQDAIDKGVKHASIPRKGKLDDEQKQYQSTRKFKELQKWRAGGEAKISLLKRMYGLRKCKYKGDKGMALCVGAGILACNLDAMARLLAG